MSTLCVPYAHLTVLETLLRMPVVNKSGERIEKFLSKLISERDFFIDGMPFQRFYSNNKPN